MRREQKGDDSKINEKGGKDSGKPILGGATKVISEVTSTNAIGNRQPAKDQKIQTAADKQAQSSVTDSKATIQSPGNKQNSNNDKTHALQTDKTLALNTDSKQAQYNDKTQLSSSEKLISTLSRKPGDSTANSVITANNKQPETLKIIEPIIARLKEQGILKSVQEPQNLTQTPIVADIQPKIDTDRKKTDSSRMASESARTTADSSQSTKIERASEEETTTVEQLSTVILKQRLEESKRLRDINEQEKEPTNSNKVKSNNKTRRRYFVQDELLSKVVA